MRKTTGNSASQILLEHSLSINKKKQNQTFTYKKTSTIAVCLAIVLSPEVYAIHMSIQSSSFHQKISIIGDKTNKVLGSIKNVANVFKSY